MTKDAGARLVDDPDIPDAADLGGVFPIVVHFKGVGGDLHVVPRAYDLFQQRQLIVVEVRAFLDPQE
jgi:hypothetical protein